jgi:mRNA interferase MazF
MKVFRGFIYWVDLDPTQGAEMSKVRPAVVISDNFMNEFGKIVVVCPITSTLHPKWKSRIQIKCAGRNCEVAVDQIRVVSKARIGAKLDELNPSSLLDLKSVISVMYAQ